MTLLREYKTDAGFRAVTFTMRDGGGYCQVYQRGTDAALISANFIDGEHTAEKCCEFADLLREAAELVPAICSSLTTVFT